MQETLHTKQTGIWTAPWQIKTVNASL